MLKLTKDNFDAEVTASSVPVLIDFFASWCGPCRMLAPVIDELDAEADGRYLIGKVNVDEEPELADAFGVNSIPAIVVMKGGTATSKSVGVKPKEELLKMLGF